ncbi:ESX secretion-associated protein EspG [Nocardia callitridis]|uniref:ESX secretion-associated protein EspG n=1 Tax=Nocardia callitridis TaxID=648753 RepID=A0ABP9L1W0_9NOCA
MSEWKWDAEDFAALWYGPAHDRFPRPLRFTSRFPLRDQAAAHARAVRDRYSPDEMEEIQLALHTLGASDLRIEIFGGTSKHKNSTGQQDLREYRIVGARTPYRAVTLMQPGTDHEHGPIRLRMIRTEDLPAHLVKSIPACQPGSEKPQTFHPDELRPRGDSYFEDNSRNTPRERYARLLHRPLDGRGCALLYAAPLHSRPKPWNVLEWHDITDDGRYTELRGEHITVRPTVAAELSGQFANWLERANKRLAEARDDAW